MMFLLLLIEINCVYDSDLASMLSCCGIDIIIPRPARVMGTYQKLQLMELVVWALVEEDVVAVAVVLAAEVDEAAVPLEVEKRWRYHCCTSYQPACSTWDNRCHNSRRRAVGKVVAGGQSCGRGNNDVHAANLIC